MSVDGENTKHGDVSLGADGDDSDDDFEYEEVAVEEDDELDAEDDVMMEDLNSAMRSLAALGRSTGGDGSGEHEEETAAERDAGAVTKHPEVIDDFIRNFLVKMGMTRTLEQFETEWYELKAAGQLPSDVGQVPDSYTHTRVLEDEVAALRREVASAKGLASRAHETWDRFRKERDFHKMHHKRVVQEKNALLKDLGRLKKHYNLYEPTIEELRHKYEVAMKEKMLIKLERDRLFTKLESIQGQDASPSGKSPATPKERAAEAPKAPPRKPSRPATTWPPSTAQNPAAGEPMDLNGVGLSQTFSGHKMGVANLCLHPTKPIAVTASDDKTWKMWHLPAGDLIMCGEGHNGWVSGIDFHPKGTFLASSSGDCTVKIWDFAKQACTATFTDHNQAVWSVGYHHSGDFVASASLDHTVRIWDLAAAKCRQCLRGHVDSVNEVCWQPYTGNICTGSSDKTVSMWDCRSGLCTQTLYGHQNSCNHVAFNVKGDVIASVDADGVVKLWDVRMVTEIATISTNGAGANKSSFDRSGEIIAVACDDGKIRLFSTETAEHLMDLEGHEDAVQAVRFDLSGKYILSCGSDNTFRLWD
uniref:Central pair associated wd-repeat protein n=1 Tax=Tetraselmis sp. GSL018 TaxID=582737 RepID=A0A061RL41_9CHLO